MKTFIPTLLFILHRLCKYMTRYDAQLRKNIPTSALPAYDAVRTACDAFLAVMAAAGND